MNPNDCKYCGRPVDRIRAGKVGPHPKHHKGCRNAYKGHMRLPGLYGVTHEARANMAVNQDHRCAICGEQTKLMIEHDHAFKKNDPKGIRGLVCSPCNRSMGAVGDDPARTSLTTRYLALYEGAFLGAGL